jgi:hypothetical protein
VLTVLDDGWDEDELDDVPDLPDASAEPRMSGSSWNFDGDPRG